jgi:hypothetical protein
VIKGNIQNFSQTSRSPAEVGIPVYEEYRFHMAFT